MADIGNLYYSVRLKDLTDSDKDKIRKKLENMGVELGVKVDASKIQAKINEATRGKGYSIKVGLDIDKSKIKGLVSTLNSSGLTTAGARMANAINSKLRTDSYVDSQRALARSRDALAALREERGRDTNAMRTQTSESAKLNQSMTSQSRIARELKGQIQNVFSVYAAERFIKSLYTIGGEFQKQKIALTSILRDESKAEKVFGQIKGLAVKSPFQFKELISYTKQLSAFSIPYEELYDTTRRLADISAGLGVDMSRIILAYGQVRSAAFLRGQEVRQFTEAGIPLLDELAKKFTELEGRAVSTSEVFDKISKREVSFGMVKDVLFGMTDDGGQFYNLQEKLADSLAGKWSNLQDAWDIMMADIAEGNNNVLGGSIDILTSLMRHWEGILSVIGPIVAGYGSLKVAIMAVNAARKAKIGLNTIQEMVNETRATKGLTAATKVQALAQHALNAAQAAAPYVIVAAAIAGLAYGIYKYVTSLSSAEAAQKSFNDSLDDMKKKSEERMEKIRGLIDIIKNPDSTALQKQLAFEELDKFAPAITEVYDSVKSLENIQLEKVNKGLNELSDKEHKENLIQQASELKKYVEMLKMIRKRENARDITLLRSRGIKGLESFGIDGNMFWDNEDWINAGNVEINLLYEELDKINNAKKKIETPTKIDIELAKDKFEQSKKNFDYISDFVLAMKNEIEGAPIEIPLDGDNSILKTDDVIKEIENKIDLLKNEQEDNPIVFSVEKQNTLNELQSLLTDIKEWKSSAFMDGAFNIPMNIIVRMNDLEKEKKDAEEYFNYLTGKYEKLEKKVVQNKSYWERIKKENEDARDLLNPDDLSKENQKKWDEYTKKIIEAQKKIDRYSDSKNAKEEKAEEKRAEKQKKLNDELIALQLKNQQDEIGLMKDGTAKKLKEIDASFKKQEEEIHKKSTDFAKLNKEARVGGLNASGLTPNQQDEIDRAYKLNLQEREKKENDIYRSEAESMRNYLIEYGTFQQQKLAIAEEYAEKIKKAQNDGERLTFEKQRDSALQKVEIDAIKQSIDWGSVFGEFGTMFKEQLQPTIEKLKEISKSDEFKSSSLQDQQTLYELISKLEQSNTVWDSDIFKRVSDDLINYQSAMQQYMSAQERLEKAKEALDRAKFDLAKAESEGDNIAALKAQVAVTEAGIAVSVASDDVQHFGVQVQDATNTLQTSAQKAKNMFSELESGVQGLASGSLKGIGQGFMKLDKLFNNTESDGSGAIGELTKDAGNTLAKGFQSLLGKDSKASKVLSEALGNSGMAGEIISAILGVLDAISQEGLSGIFTGLQDTIFGALEKQLEDILSGDIVIKPIENSLSHIGKILNTVSFGGFDSLMSSINGSNAKEVAETTNRLTNRNEMLQKSIDALKDSMDRARGAESVKVYEEAVKKQKEFIKNSSDILAAQMSYSGSHHSNNYYINKSLNKNEWDRISAQVGKSITNVGQLWSLSPEELRKVSELTDIWDKIYNGGKYDKSEYLDAYLDTADSLTELESGLKETLTQISFDSMYDSFIDSLMDMDKSSQDFANDISKYFMQAMLSNKIGEKYSEDLEGWYNDFAEAMKSDNTLSDAEIAGLNKRYNAIVEAAIADRDAIAAATGYESSSTSSGLSKGIESVTEDTANLLASYINGIRADVSVNREYLRSLVEDSFPSFSLIAEAQLQQLTVIANNTGRNVLFVEEIRDILNGARQSKDKGIWIR